MNMPRLSSIRRQRQGWVNCQFEIGILSRKLTMVTSDLNYLCKLPMAQLYFYDPTRRKDPAKFSLCPEVSTTCYDPSRGCFCRNSTAVNIGGSTVQLAVCSITCSGPNTIDCTLSSDNPQPIPEGSIVAGSATYGSDQFSAASTDASGHGMTTATTPNSGGSASLPTGNSSSKGVSSTDFSNSMNGSTSSDTVPTTAVATASSSSSINTPVVLGIIVGCVIFAALVSWLVRGYCIRKRDNTNKSSNRTSDVNASSPANLSSLPSFLNINGRSENDNFRGQRDAYGASTSRDYSGEGAQYAANENRRYMSAAMQYGTASAFEYGNADVKNEDSYDYENTQQPSRYTNQMYNVYNPLGANDGHGSRAQGSLFTQQVAPRINQNGIPLSYSDLSKNSGSIVPSIASSATTVEMPGRRYQTQGSQKRRHPSSSHMSGVSVVSDATSNAASSGSGDDYIPPFRLLRQQQSGNHQNTNMPFFSADSRFTEGDNTYRYNTNLRGV